MKTLQLRFIFKTLICCLLLLIAINVRASHNAGGSLTYTHLNGNSYLLHVTLFRDCMGIPAPNTVTINVESVTLGTSLDYTANPIPGTGQSITMECPGAYTSCSGGFNPGYEKWEYEVVVSLGIFPDWVFSTEDCCRSGYITTLSNPGSEGTYLEARMNNTLGANSSPQFTVNPNIYVCSNTTYHYNFGTIDPDGDSLAYTFTTALSQANQSVIYDTGYSPTNPISSSPAVSLDPVTGDMVVNATAIEIGVIAIMVAEYRNGQLIGTVMRDVNIFTQTCTNHYPVLSGIDGTNQYSVYVLAGSSFCFSIFSSDSDATDTTSVTWNYTGPAGMCFAGGVPHQAGTFCWSTSVNDVRSQPYLLTATVRDNHCPMNNATVYSYYLYVTLDSSLVTPLSHFRGFISGNVYLDVNSNGARDTLEPGMGSQRMEIQPDGLVLYTNTSGDYSFLSLIGGSHVITTVPQPNWTITSDSLTYTVVDDSVDQSGFDFGINSLVSINQLDLNIASGFPRCNTDVYYYLNYENTGTTILNGRAVFICDPATNFVSSNPPPDQSIGDSLFFNFTNLYPFSSGQVEIVLHLPGGGSWLNFDAFIEFDSSGTYVLLDQQSLPQTVSCAFDPNDKAVSPEGLYANHYTMYDETLLYTIRFQNTGNDTAFNAVVRDMIDPSLDINTFHVTGSSHPMVTSIYPSRLVEFRFDNILLPDSIVDEPGSNGFVQFRILATNGISLPKLVSNNAFIYFDSNLPVQTNTVSNTLVMQLPVGITQAEYEKEFSLIVPNPFHDQAEIILSNSFLEKGAQLKVMNVLGEVVFEKSALVKPVMITSSKINPGIYFYEVINKNGERAGGKFIIE